VKWIGLTFRSSSSIYIFLRILDNCADSRFFNNLRCLFTDLSSSGTGDGKGEESGEALGETPELLDKVDSGKAVTVVIVSGAE
jgi:hypothetical protein